MADDKQQPGRDKAAPAAAGTPAPTPGAVPDSARSQAPDQVPPSAAVPADNDIFGDLFAREPAQEDLFSSLAEFASNPDSFRAGPLPPLPSPEAHTPSRRGGFLGMALHLRGAGHLSPVQKILAASIVLIAAAILYVLLVRTTPGTPAEPAPPTPVAAEDQPTSKPSGPTPEPVKERPPEARGPVPASPAPRAEASLGGSPREYTPLEPQILPSPEPLSLQLADKLYLRRDFEPALVMYDKLYRRLPAAEDSQSLRDFLVLRMALCHKNSGQTPQADNLLRTASLSRLPLLRALARYHQSTTLLGRKRYLEAVAKAYQTLALIEVADYDKKWVSAVEQQCQFLVAEAMTRHVLSLCDADANLPRELWGVHPDIDPLVGVDEPQLRVLLAAGLEQLEGATLSPQIRSTGDKGAVPHWSVICNGAPLEELLARLTTNAGGNVRWPENGQTPPTEDNLRARPVSLYLTAATTPQAVTTAAGSVGLLAQTDDKGDLRLLDPASYSSLTDHTKLLAQEAVTLWQRLLLTAENDQRAANAHFATALLQTANGQFDQALAEYKVVSAKFGKSGLAPHALLRSGMLKVRLRDYVGAHADLKQLVEIYPESDLADRACLYLADATMKAGLYQEAIGLYRKVYNMGLSVEAQAQSALGAGRCLYETKEYEEAAQWLSRYVTLTRDRSRPAFSAACLLLGKACLALHKPQQAQTALNLAFKGELSHQQHVETIAVLVKTYLEQGLYLEALNTLEGTTGWQLSQQEAVELALLRAQTYRAIGLAHKAIALLEEKSRYTPSPELQARAALELAKCESDSGDLESARKTLSQAFATAEPGPLANQIGRELAGVCLRLGQTEQATSVCAQLLERASASERQSILILLTDAYRRQGKYSEAMTTMLDRYSGPDEIKDN